MQNDTPTARNIDAHDVITHERFSEVAEVSALALKAMDSRHQIVQAEIAQQIIHRYYAQFAGDESDGTVEN